MHDEDFDGDWETEDDLASLPGCLQTRRIEPSDPSRPAEADGDVACGT